MSPSTTWNKTLTLVRIPKRVTASAVGRWMPRAFASVALLAVLIWSSASANAETIAGAMAKAYLNNPDINQQRAVVRVSDENIPKANAGYLPTINAQASYSLSNERFASGIQSVDIGGGAAPVGGGSGSLFSRPAGLEATINENIWNGNRTINSVRQAESGIL